MEQFNTFGHGPAAQPRHAGDYPGVVGIDAREQSVEHTLQEPSSPGRLDASPRGMAMHPCGVIITDATLLDRLPVQPTPGGGFPMVQAAAEEVEALGLIKLDVLI
ncbi:hypothetical protein OG928_44435 (plasmid) [Embleya sp. NBC_00896]|nr:hypothetical protein OG928_44435 [Embleya sp. NBC_00896]